MHHTPVVLLHNRSCQGPDDIVQQTRFNTSLGSMLTFSLPYLHQDTEVLPLIRDGTIWTLGADSMDIDYEHTWRTYLAHDSYKANGRSTKQHLCHFAVVLLAASLLGCCALSRAAAAAAELACAGLDRAS